jgi:hypothetical protein
MNADKTFLSSVLAGRPEAQDDWEGLIRLAADEFVLPALHERLEETGVKPPAEVGEFLAAVEEMNAERNARVLDEAVAIAEVLNAIGIEPVALKGAAFLIEGVYPRPGCRYLCDLDLLVPQSRLREAAAALEREGYRPDRSDAMAHFRHHYPQLQRPRGADGSGSAAVELHHSLGHGPSRKLLSADEVFRESSLREVNGARMRVPAPEHLATHLILHSQLHHRYRDRIWPPLRAMYDLAMLVRRFGSRLDWEEVRRLFCKAGEEPTLLLHLLQVQETLGLEPPLVVDLGPLEQVRWWRRQALNRRPLLRFADPYYLASAALSRRMQFLTSVASAPGGWKHAALMLFRRGFYRRLLEDVALR